MNSKLEDIAKYLNISVSTVSRAVTGKNRISPETRQRVLEAVEKFNYYPNEIARNLKNKTTNAIGVIIPDISNNFFTELVKGLEYSVRDKKYTIILCNSDEDKDRENEYLNLLMEKQIAGLVLATVSDEFEYIKKYKAAGIPIVFIDNMPRYTGDFDSVTINNVNASYELINYLLGLGHKKILIISGPLHESTGKDTFLGWEKGLVENGINIKKEWIGYGNFKIDSGYKIMKEFLKHKEFPMAVFAANNNMAYGAAKAIMEENLTIPDDVSIVTFGAVDNTGLIRPRFTSIIEPAETIGRIAGEIIMRKLSNPSIKIYEKVVLEHQFVIGDSCCQYRD